MALVREESNREQGAEDPTDIFDTALSSIFDIPPIAFSTASPDAFHTYTPPAGAFAEAGSPIDLRLPHPPPDLYTKLQANNLWLAAIFLSDSIARDEIELEPKHTVCELGAGAGLPGIVAGRKGCRVVSSDWGVDEVLDVIRDNFARAKIDHEDWKVVGHEWGTDVTPLLTALESPTSTRNKFDTLLLADTLWVTEAQSALLDSIHALLKPNGIAHIAAGLHTGRGPLERFVAAARARGATVTKIKEVRWNSGEWEVYTPPEKEQEERGVVVYYTLVL